MDCTKQQHKKCWLASHATFKAAYMQLLILLTIFYLHLIDAAPHQYGGFYLLAHLQL